VSRSGLDNSGKNECILITDISSETDGNDQMHLSFNPACINLYNNRILLGLYGLPVKNKNLSAFFGHL
jgi:hypothetical protein